MRTLPGPHQGHHKTWMLENGEWRATAKPENDNGKTAGFHLSSLYSPIGWRSWVQIAGAWLAARGSDAAVKSVKNTDLGETWEEVGEAPDWQRLYDRREDYREGTVPAGGLLLTAGVDIQKAVSRFPSGPGEGTRSPGWSNTG